MNDKPQKRSMFSPLALLGFMLICAVLGWGIATRSRALNVGLMLVYAGWLVIGSGAVLRRWWKHRQREQG